MQLCGTGGLYGAINRFVGGFCADACFVLDPLVGRVVEDAAGNDGATELERYFVLP